MTGWHTIFCDNFVKDGYYKLLQCSGRRVVDNCIFAALQNEANVQRGNEQLALKLRGVVLKKRRQGLQDF